jgi:putative transposase
MGDRALRLQEKRTERIFQVWIRQAELAHPEAQSVRKTYQYRLCLAPKPAWMVESVLWRCRTLYNAAFEERETAWERRRVSVNYYQQKAELPDIKQVAGGLLSLSKIGRIRILQHRPLEGIPTTITISREVDGWYATISCADVPAQPRSATGQETGRDLGAEALATRADGARIFIPGWYRKAEQALKTAQRRVSRRQKGSRRQRKAVALPAKAHQAVRRQRGDFHHKVALQLARATDVIYHEDLQTPLWSRTTTPPSLSLTQAGRRS